MQTSRPFFARYADEAIHIGPAPSSESYLIGANIIKAAQSVGADAIHPGYGFLIRKCGFSDAVRDCRPHLHWTPSQGH